MKIGIAYLLNSMCICIIMCSLMMCTHVYLTCKSLFHFFKGLFQDTIVPIVVGISDLNIFRVAQVQKPPSCFICGTSDEFFVAIGKMFTSPGDWIMECCPSDGKIMLETF